MITPLKLFGKGQITLPKIWRDKFDTKLFVAEEVSEGLLIKPLVEKYYYEIDESNFGLYFPSGIEAKKLAKSLKKAHARLR